MSKTKPNTIVVLQETGNDSFGTDEAWRNSIQGKAICAHCHWPYPDTHSIDAYVNNRKRRTDIDSIGPFVSGVRAFSKRLIDIVGRAKLERIAGLGRIFDIKGFEHDTHQTVIAKKTVLIRDDGTGAHLCRNCDQLLYSGRGDQYVLRSQLPKDPFFISGSNIFCTERFWRERIFDATLTRVIALEFPIRDKAEDGLPDSTEEIKAYLKRRKRYARVG